MFDQENVFEQKRLSHTNMLRYTNSFLFVEGIVVLPGEYNFPVHRCYHFSDWIEQTIRTWG